MFNPFFTLVLLLTTLVSFRVLAYEATWESLDSRPLPSWYEEAKFGIFIHWGVFSVPAYRGEWMWHMWGKNGDNKPDPAHDKPNNTMLVQEFIKKTELPKFAYADYAHRFDATLYDAHHWAKVFAASGAQYVVLTGKHHEGFCNWDSRNLSLTWNWNSMDVGPRRDLVGELAKEVKSMTSHHTNQKIHFGLYHSLYEWYNPLYEADKQSKFATSNFVKLKTMPELYDIVKQYEPELIWSDGDWEANSTYWDSKQFLAWYATNSSVAETAVWNDRWGTDAMCKHGSYITCHDRYLPDKLLDKKWENALTITTTSWGYDRSLTLESYYTTEYLIHTLIQTVAFNGNMLLNVGPRADGTLDPIFEERLIEIGDWLAVNGEAIFKSRPWSVNQQEKASKVFYTTTETKQEDKSTSNSTLYAIFTEWPDDFWLHLSTPVPTDKTTFRLLGLPHAKAKREHFLKWEAGGKGIDVRLPVLPPGKAPCQHAWTLAITNIANFETNADRESTASTL